MKAYIAGPMSNYENLNFPAFFKAESYLEWLGPGFVVVNPAKNDGGETWEEALAAHLDNPKSWEHYLRRDLQAMLSCDAIYTLPEWNRSRGARLEVDTAIEVGIRIYHNNFDHISRCWGKRLVEEGNE